MASPTLGQSLLHIVHYRQPSCFSSPVTTDFCISTTYNCIIGRPKTRDRLDTDNTFHTGSISLSPFAMRVFDSDCTFDYSWEEVSTANWRKYCPWNDKSPHVVAVDTLSRRVDPSTGILRTERLITCHQAAPQWVKTLIGGGSTSHVYEVSYVDPVSKKVTMCSTNMTWSNLLACRETVIYQPSGADPQQKTDFKQEAKIFAFCGGLQKIKTKIEEASVERFRENALRGREGFEAVLEMSRRVFGEQREIEMRQKAHA